jgi:hypothetical protein
MGQLVYQDDLGLTGQDRIDIHFADFAAATGCFTRGDHFDAFKQGIGFGLVVSFDQADDQVCAFGLFAPGRFQHGIGLADTGSITEKNP